MKSYLFRIGFWQFILNIQYSTIGYGYPRLFIRCPDNSYMNADFSLGTIFRMFEEDWNSWLDDELIKLSEISEVKAAAEEHGLNFENLMKFINEVMEEGEEGE